MPNQSDRRDYNIGVSQEVQDNVNRIANQLEALIDKRDADVKAAMADYAADGVSDSYHNVEVRWANAATETRGIIALVRQLLEHDDGHASTALSKARAAVESVG